MREKKLPLEGIRVLDFGHTVMGPTCGMILADMGADVIKIEPLEGDRTRNLKGFGTGYFGYFNRNKRSISIDLKSARGIEIFKGLVTTADIVVENFAPNTMERLNIGYDDLKEINPRLIYASLKGFLEGPYQQRLALDEVVQMMAGLAYMTGPSGRPLRAGTSVVDITGGIFAVIAILLALRERDTTGLGQKVATALFESTVMLMGQHLCYSAQIDESIPPMPERVSAWAVYEIFDVAQGDQLFVGLTSDRHWERFCHEVKRPDLLLNPAYATNESRIDARDTLIPDLRQLLSTMPLDEAIAVCERAQIPFSPINRPENLFDDVHLKATNGLMPTTLTNGIKTQLPRLPIRMESAQFDLRTDPPQIGQHTTDILTELGLDKAVIDTLVQTGVVRTQA
jgi:crotonobetainyl-CoA:carnitine CoA-transferase CaiB-like acyl-CoA transferase